MTSQNITSILLHQSIMVTSADIYLSKRKKNPIFGTEIPFQHTDVVLLTLTISQYGPPLVWKKDWCMSSSLMLFV